MAEEHKLKLISIAPVLIESLRLGLISFDTDLNIIEANSSAVKILSDSQNNSNKSNNSLWHKLRNNLGTVIKDGKMCNFNSETSPKADNTPKALRISAFPLREKGSNYIMGGFLVIEDITENANIKMSLADMEQLATLGKMTTKIAHELNNPLDGILRYLNLATRSIEFENIEKPKEYIEQCRKGITRMINIVQELLQFSRTSYAPLELISLEKIIDDALTIMEPNIHAANVEVFKKYCTPTPNVKAGNLFQVFCNLVKNALDAMGAGGKLEISISMKDSQNVIVKFTDTGHGIKTENIDLIFKPFFTTKEHGKGTGLGLAICKDIIENYRGSIHAENSPTGGSIFTINLPTGI